MSNYYDPGNGKHVIVDGCIVERDALRIAEAIKDYDENLELLCYEGTDLSNEPYVVAYRGPDNVLRPVLRAWELNDLILQRIHAADSQKFDQLETIDAENAKVAKESESRYRDLMEENREIVKGISGMKSKYTVHDPRNGDLLTFFDDRPVIRTPKEV